MHICCSALSLLPDAILIFATPNGYSLSSSVEVSRREAPATEILPANSQHHLFLQHYFTLRCWCQVCLSTCANCLGRCWIPMQGITWVLCGLMPHRLQMLSQIFHVRDCAQMHCRNYDNLLSLSPSKFILDKFSGYNQQEAANVAGTIYISALFFTTVAGSLIVRIQTCLPLWIIMSGGAHLWAQPLCSFQDFVGLRGIILLACTILTLPVSFILAFTNIYPLISTIWLGVAYSFVAVSLDPFECSIELTAKKCRLMYYHLTPAIHIRGRRGKSFRSETQTLLSATSSGSLKGFLGCCYVSSGWTCLGGILTRYLNHIHCGSTGLLSYLCT